MKPREWELFWSGLSLHWSVRESPIGQYSDDQYIKVVDRAAYDALAEENRKLRSALQEIAEKWDECQDSDRHGAMDYYDGYRSCETARNALAADADGEGEG